jgi:hypothetical protein
MQLNNTVEKGNHLRGHSELYQEPIDLHSIDLPLSYAPFYRNHVLFNVNKHCPIEHSYALMFIRHRFKSKSFCLNKLPVSEAMYSRCNVLMTRLKKQIQIKSKKKSIYEEALGVEPRTYRSAVDCSTTELYLLSCNCQLHFKKKTLCPIQPAGPRNSAANV